MQAIHEAKLMKMKQQAERFYETYRDHMDALDKSMLARTKKGSLDYHDVYALGKQLEQYKMFEQYINETAGSLNQLGNIPNIALDVITAVHGSAIMPVIASVQTVEEEQGTVWFQQVRAATTRGAQTSGDILVDPRQQIVTPTGYASGAFTNVTIATSVATQVAYSATLAGAPVRAQTLSVALAPGAVQGKDIGPATGGDPNIGQIWGIGVSGTVNYATGQVSLTLAADPGAGHAITASYQQNFEQSTDIPQVDPYYASKTVFARVYALKGMVGLLQTFAMGKRFGISGDDTLAKTLVEQINLEIGGDMIRLLKANAVGTDTFNRTPPDPSISYFNHKQTWFDKLSDVEATINTNAGRGSVNRLILGKNHASLVATLPGFKKIYDGNGMGAHVFGELENQNIVVIRVNEAALLGANEGIALWHNPATPFDSAAVYMPYMPLTMTDLLPMSPNPLQKQRGAATMAGVDVMVPAFATLFNVA